jgi:CheY-like chemotaxis protein
MMPSHVVLYIDDSEDNIRLVTRMMRRHPGLDLRAARTGRDGVSMAIADHPDLILLDNRLPDCNGAQVLGEIAADPSTAAIPVVVVSGDSDRRTIDALLAAGAADYVLKPFDIHGLMAVIWRHLG